MKLNFSKEWYEYHLSLEGDEEIGIGVPPGFLQQQKNITPFDSRIAFGTFVELWRRNKGWGAEELAEKSNLDIEEILEIEHDPNSIPEVSAVYNLAEIFALPVKALLEIAGLTEPQNSNLREEAVRFAARSESIEALNPREKEAFEAFVSTIAETS